MDSTATKVPRFVLFSILGTALLSFCGILTETSMNVTFPTLMRQFHISIGAVQWLTTGYLLIASLVMIMASYIHKRFTFKATFVTALVLFVIGLVVCAVATSFPVLLIGRLIGGIATGLCTPVMFGIITQFVPSAKMGRYMSIGGMILGFAPTVGPTYGGLVLYYMGWRMIFWIVLPIVAVSFLFGYFNIRQRVGTQQAHFDTLGFTLIAVAFVTISLGFNDASKHGWSSLGFWGLVLVGIVALVGYGWWATRTAQPLINIAIFKRRTFVLSFLTYLSLQLSNIGLGFLLPNYAQLVIGANAMKAGLLLLPGSVLRTILMPLGGSLLDRRGPRVPILTGLVCLIIAMAGFVLNADHLSVGWIIGIYIIYSVGFSMTFSNTLANGMQQLSPKLIGDGNAAFNAIQQYAGSIGTAVMATVVAISQNQAGKLSSVEATARGGLHDFIILLVLTIIMIVLASFNFKFQQQDKKA
ncbi:DHA2 family efflux MFS transporter permease subunit [Furfurilactobacillus rossiae]|uniref:Permease of the major facilitator superfamily n=1 Tax=Furfurilactobacillus rossiae DSM 15814 TaxID=1114972 RepID=A0A0R1RDE2_9LACO|nr:DHA2 family efflux MFS transporter permease subunit [Furfurilactobacillus rossiae]KRL54991.1 permease of the major facilitator superfamily [Furfurilactobacillus rossiae DSM 15814]QFR67787.1 DHA2 family efflux MFS transporter permease subunit [Furfurilactobacillus rossiae]QLE60762.1 permease of the major facilitator [Furfurilactobacillus rossiae]